MAATNVTITAVKVNNAKTATTVSAKVVATEVYEGHVIARTETTNPGVVS